MAIRLGAIRALEAATGKMKWEFTLKSPPWAGVISTAGGLVFGGSDEGNFFALDALPWQAVLGLSDRRPNGCEPDQLLDGRQAACRDGRGSRAVCVWAAMIA